MATKIVAQPGEGGPAVAESKQLQECRAQRFVLTDAEGRERAILGTTPEDATILIFLDAVTGEARVGVRLDKIGPLIFMDGPGEKRGFEILLRCVPSFSEVIGEIVFYDGDDRKRLQLGIGTDNSDRPRGVVLFDVGDDGSARAAAFEEVQEASRTFEEPTTTPEDTLRAAGISGRRQARYQRRMSSLLAGRA